jgi:hypothetical protein
MQLNLNSNIMNETVLTREQLSQIAQFEMALSLLQESYPVADLFVKLAEKVPNNYDYGTIVKEVVSKLKTEKII